MEGFCLVAATERPLYIPQTKKIQLDHLPQYGLCWQAHHSTGVPTLYSWTENGVNKVIPNNAPHQTIQTTMTGLGVPFIPDPQRATTVALVAQPEVLPSCSLCKMHIKDEEGLVKYNEQTFHTNCCMELLALTGRTTRMTLLKQPEEWQVAHYNIIPMISLKIEQNNKLRKEFITATLVENTTGFPIPGGLIDGFKVEYNPAVTDYTFQSLKLGRMGVAKNALQRAGMGIVGRQFCVEFKLGETTIRTYPFNMVSNIHSMPDKFKDRRHELHHRRSYRKRDMVKFYIEELQRMSETQ